MRSPSRTHGFLGQFRDKDFPDEAERRSAFSRREFMGLGTAWLIASALFAPSISCAGLLPPNRIESSNDDPQWPIGSTPFLSENEHAQAHLQKASPLFLTFDDGPARCTGSILDYLSQTGQRATFFVIGHNLRSPSLRKLAIMALEDGHDLGNHSYTHPSFSTLSANHIEQEIVKTHKCIEELARDAGASKRERSLFFRFPFGHTGRPSVYTAAMKILHKLGYHVAWWDLDTSDWRMDTAFCTGSQVVASLRTVKPRDVVLLHERELTARILPSLLEVLKSRNLVSATMSAYDSRWSKRWKLARTIRDNSKRVF
jgi:peptidoglycan/xylan/chitin deacetylase (PgdA/CDA1 family)